MRFRVFFLTVCLCWPLSGFAADDLADDATAVIARLKTAAAAGDEKAQLDLARRYLDGNGVAADIDQSIAYYLLAAERDIAFAQQRLAWIYLGNAGVDADPVEAERWLLRAAHLGFVAAQLDLSRFYESYPEESPDRVAALKWLMVAQSLSEDDFSDRQQALAMQMNALQRGQAVMLARFCMMRAYRDC